MMDTKEALKELDDLTVDYGNRNEEQIARIDEAIDMAIGALKAQTDGDTISRQDVIDTVHKIIYGFFSCADGVMTDTEKTLLSVSKAVCNGVRELPSAQPEERTEERTETHACDLIDRQAAIDALNKLKIYRPLDSDRYVISDCLNKIVNLPSAQPEIIRCKDCKHWKDSDGVYRRGIGAESKCPMNIWPVYDGVFYCGYAERRTDGIR